MMTLDDLEKIFCSTCNKSAKEVEMSRCSRCKVVYYCNQSCQLEHWAVHQKTCTPVNDLESEEEKKFLSPQNFVGNTSISESRVDKSSSEETESSIRNKTNPSKRFINQNKANWDEERKFWSAEEKAERKAEHLDDVEKVHSLINDYRKDPRLLSLEKDRVPLRTIIKAMVLIWDDEESD